MSWFSKLTVRGRTLLVGSAFTVVFVAVGSAVPIPYVKLGPGVTINTLGSYDGSEVFTFTGNDIPASVNENFGEGSHLNMTTVSVTDGISLFGAIALWASGKYTVTPRDEIYPPDKTTDEVKAENARTFLESQSFAQTAALRYLKYPEVAYVQQVGTGSPSDGRLEVQDRILSIDGAAVTDLDSLQQVMEKTTPGQVVTVRVERAGTDGKLAELDEKVTLQGDPEKKTTQGYLGIVTTQRPEAPFQIHNSLETSGIGGPSAGLMFTLGLIDRLTPGDLTGGNFIAGTGTIDIDGTVGPIGGILLKLIAAKDVGASYFLVPAANCEEAVTRIPDGLHLAKVGSLDEAMAAVTAISKGEVPASC
ncbi:PDZ domain-containing protein [Nakamurella silvestris]|nr:PDZ domain-containing protein [Nakamurella silvestris]